MCTSHFKSNAQVRNSFPDEYFVVKQRKNTLLFDQKHLLICKKNKKETTNSRIYDKNNFN